MTDDQTTELDQLRDSQEFLEAGVALLPAAAIDQAIGVVTLDPKVDRGRYAFAERAARIEIERLRSGDAAPFADALETAARSSALSAVVQPPMPSNMDPVTLRDAARYVSEWRNEVARAERTLTPLLDRFENEENLVAGRVLIYLVRLAQLLRDPESAVWAW